MLVTSRCSEQNVYLFHQGNSGEGIRLQSTTYKSKIPAIVINGLLFDVPIF